MKTDRHVLVAGADPELQQAVGAAARAMRHLGVEICRGDDPASVLQRVAAAVVSVVEVDLGQPEAIDRFQWLVRNAREARVVAAAPGADGEQIRRLFRAGAADVLTGPFTPELLRTSLGELLRSAGTEPLAGGVVSVVKGCGGAGATTVALNLAAALAGGDPKRARPARRTAVLDLDLQFGDAEVALDLSPRSTLADVVLARERVDPRFLEGVMAEHASGLKLLAAPPSLAPLDALGVDFALDLVEHAAAGFERTVIDLPGAWTDWTLAVLARSDLIVVVTTPTVAGALGAKRAAEALKAAGVERPTVVVLNSLEGVLTSLERPGRIGRTLDLPIEAVLPLDPACAKAAERGRLAIDAAPKARIAKELRAFARRVDDRLHAVGAGLADAAAEPVAAVAFPEAAE